MTKHAADAREAHQQLVQICRGATSLKELQADLKTKPVNAKGWAFFPDAVRFAETLDRGDLGAALEPVEKALERLADAAGDVEAKRVLGRS